MFFFEEAKSGFVTRTLTLMLSVVGVYPQFRALRLVDWRQDNVQSLDLTIRTLGMGYGWLPGDWQEDHQTTKILHMIEPVSEGIMQFFCQTIILYVIAGPSESNKSERLIDLSSLAFDESLSSKVLYLSLLSSSLITVCSSLARVEHYQSKETVVIIFSI